MYLAEVHLTDGIKLKKRNDVLVCCMYNLYYKL